jgi:hypothetical protein
MNAGIFPTHPYSLFVDNTPSDETKYQDIATDTESDYDSDDDFDDIEFSETEFDETEKQDGKYYLGVPFTFRSFNTIMMNCSISASTFLKHDYTRVVEYLNSIASFYFHSNNQVDILKLHINGHAEYTVVIKTHWLRIVQRRWRNILRQRNAIFAKRASVQNQEYFRMHGRYLPGTRNLPNMRGMLYELSSNPTVVKNLQ